MPRTKTIVKAKPATKAKPANTKPATKKPAKSEGISLQDLADRLNREPKSVRASIRRALKGPQVGRGGRYSWPSWKDPELVKLMKVLDKG